VFATFAQTVLLFANHIAGILYECYENSIKNTFFKRKTVKALQVEIFQRKQEGD